MQYSYSEDEQLYKSEKKTTYEIKAREPNNESCININEFGI